MFRRSNPFLDWISWLNISILLATLAIGLFNASNDDIARDFAYFYALVSVGVLVRWFHPNNSIPILPFQIYGYSLYQHRITMIRRRDPGHFGFVFPLFNPSVTLTLFVDALAGPVILSIALFIGILANFVIRGSFSFIVHIVSCS